MQWFCRMNAVSSQNRIPPKRSSLHQCRCRLKTTLMLVLLSAYCISSLHAHRRSSSSPSFLRHAQKSVISAFVTNENDVAIIRRQKHHSQGGSSSTISKNESILYRTQLIATTTVTRQSSSSPSLSLLLMASSTTSSSSSSSAETQPTNNNRQQLPQSPPLVSKSKIESQIEQLENQQNVQKKKQQLQQQQQQRYPKKKGTESPTSSTLSSTKKCSSTKKNQQQQQQQHQHHHRTNNNKKQQRCSIPQNKKRQVRYLYTKAKQLEKRGLWREASNMYERIVTELQPNDAHSYLAWGRLESRRERGVGGGGVGRRGSKDHHDDDDGVDDTTTKDDTSMRTSNSSSKASTIFQTGTKHCPNSTHLYHGWAIHEQYTLHNTSKARSLLQTALSLDPNNGYVCHAYGLLEHTMGEVAKAKSLWQQGLVYQPSAALVCSLGEMYVASGDFHSARELYSTYLSKLSKGRERTEVYLAAASLEERVYNDVEKASELLRRACSEGGSGGVGGGGERGGGGGAIMDGRAYVALAKLGTSRGLVNDKVVKKRLKEICMRQLNYHEDKKRGKTADNSDDGKRKAKNKIIFPVNDGRLFNAWAKMESKSGNLSEARKILGRGMELYPNDYTLLQAAGNIEERLGNTGSARKLYAASLAIEPSAPALIAYALLELRSPIDAMTKVSNVTMVRKLFEEALLIDPKHGPAYNAFGNLERRQGNTAYARQIYENGIKANCTDAPSVYHGLAKLHLSLGEVEEARNVLQRGLALFPTLENNTLVQRNENVAFLAHTLAMIDLNVNNNAKHAKEVLQQGLWHCRNSPQLLLGMALCESRLGNDNGARDMFEKSLMADQTHAQAWQAFGVMEMRAGNFRSAKLLFECGLKNSPTHGALWLAYGTLESWKGNVGTARILFAAGIEKCPNHVPLYQAWACLELQHGDVITAKRLIGEALTRDKRNGSGWLVAAQIEEKMDNHGLVGLILRRGIECAPGDAELYIALADHEISRGKIDSARELLEKGMEINPLHAPLYHSLAELEARVFNIEGLAKLNKRAAEIFQSDVNAPPTDEAMRAMGRQMKHVRSTKMPDGVAALAEKIGVESDEPTTIAGVSMDDVDLDSLVNNVLCGFGGESGMMLQQQEGLM